MQKEYNLELLCNICDLDQSEWIYYIKLFNTLEELEKEYDAIKTKYNFNSENLNKILKK